MKQSKQHWSILCFFRRFFNEFEFDAISNIMFVFMTSMTFHFKKIYEIFIFKRFNFFVRNFVSLTSFFTIFASFFFIFRFVSTNRILHIITFTDVINIWLSIKKFILSDFVRIKITIFFFIERNLCVFELFSQLFQLFTKKNLNTIS